MKKVLGKIKDFIIDYCQRHAHPTNALLHIIGVPAAFYGLYKLISGSVQYGLSLLVLGYWLQYLGHRAQGNEVGEVTLIKSSIAAIKNFLNSKMNGKQNNKNEA